MYPKRTRSTHRTKKQTPSSTHHKNPTKRTQIGAVTYFNEDYPAEWFQNSDDDDDDEEPQNHMSPEATEQNYEKSSDFPVATTRSSSITFWSMPTPSTARSISVSDGGTESENDTEMSDVFTSSTSQSECTVADDVSGASCDVSNGSCDVTFYSCADVSPQGKGIGVAASLSRLLPQRLAFATTESQEGDNKDCFLSSGEGYDSAHYHAQWLSREPSRNMSIADEIAEVEGYNHGITTGETPDDYINPDSSAESRTADISAELKHNKSNELINGSDLKLDNSKDRSALNKTDENSNIVSPSKQKAHINDETQNRNMVEKDTNGKENGDLKKIETATDAYDALINMQAKKTNQIGTNVVNIKDEPQESVTTVTGYQSTFVFTTEVTTKHNFGTSLPSLADPSDISPPPMFPSLDGNELSSDAEKHAVNLALLRRKSNGMHLSLDEGIQLLAAQGKAKKTVARSNTHDGQVLLSSSQNGDKGTISHNSTSSNDKVQAINAINPDTDVDYFVQSGLFSSGAVERLESRRDYLHALVDRWCDKMKVRMHGVEQRAEERMQW